MRARRYVQCDFADRGALERVMLREIRSVFFYMKIMKSNRLNVKHWKKHWNYEINLIPLHCSEFGWITTLITYWWCTRNIAKMKLSVRFWKIEKLKVQKLLFLFAQMSHWRWNDNIRNVSWSCTATTEAPLGSPRTNGRLNSGGPEPTESNEHVRQTLCRMWSGRY